MHCNRHSSTVTLSVFYFGKKIAVEAACGRVVPKGLKEAMSSDLLRAKTLKFTTRFSKKRDFKRLPQDLLHPSSVRRVLL